MRRHSDGLSIRGAARGLKSVLKGFFIFDGLFISFFHVLFADYFATSGNFIVIFFYSFFRVLSRNALVVSSPGTFTATTARNCEIAECRYSWSIY